ncbi:hypothetical protein [Yersinia phage fHe-Yen9-04]|uniref:Uncharacterized protein n=2 Tax=Eneladusvirus Yen904 TaxID=2560849 RepID=A0A2C9CXK7_9CAUD|nr:hypothetical protein FDJ41_gp286 [Yersinia phage fHe-Yen9-04]SOK58563.1 hypothetical protein [Yersinia phage fHe-Yen9-04]SOK59099.1 hypothetical protein [Yersinia phage fHe-Yen9-03]VUE36332.1 hypothetical protein [Yersinia phage fHe-Yen9-04]
MKNNKINENASAGSTSAGSIATVSGGLNYPLTSRLPPTNFFGYKEYKPKKHKKD